MTGGESGTRLGYLPAVDGLRAVAVVSVILFHARLLPAGYAGVDIFFVISGFVVTGSAIGRRFESLRAMLVWFYARRLVRIMPALLAMLLVVVLATQLFVPDAWLSNSVPHVGIAAFFGLSNVVLAIDADSYFGVQAAVNPFTHSWSLGVEEQFYLLFPLLLYAQLRIGDAPAREGRTQLIVAGLTLASLAICALLPQNLAFYLILSRFWELGAGMLLCLTIGHWRPWLAGIKPLHRAEIALAALALVTAGVAIPESAGFPFPLALLPAIGTAGLIAVVVAMPESIPARLLGTRPMVAIGKLSYSLYLWHWPVLVLFRWTVGLHTLPLQLTALGLGIALAALSYFLVEQPLRTASRIAAMPRGRVVALGIGAMLTAGALGQAMFLAHDRITLSVTRDHDAWYADNRFPLDPAASCGVRYEQIPIAGTQLIAWTPEKCKRALAGFTLHAIGDSHAVAYTPAYRRLASGQGIAVRAWARPRCPFLKLNEPPDPRCAPLFEEMVRNLEAQVRPGDVIFLPALRLTRITSRFGPDRWPNGLPDDRVSPESLEDARMWLLRLAATEVPVILEAPKPIFPSPAFRCSDWFNRANPVCAGGLTIARDKLEAQRASVLAAMRRLEREIPGVRVWDPFPILCPGATCSAVPGGRPLVLDGDHLSGHGNMLVYPSLRAVVTAASSR